MAAPASRSPSSDDQPATDTMRRIGRYLVLREIKRGGQGVVYHALDPAIGRELAIKELLLSHLEPGEIPKARERFRREARAVGKLRHANIVTLHDFIEEPALYLVMEFVAGSLRDLIGRGTPLTTVEVLQIVRQVASALDEAHANGIVHRDIKPENILVSTDRPRAGPLVKVADFGIARIISETITTTGLVMGTLKYMAPEQLNGSRADDKADQFSLGVVAYELLAHKLPFAGSSIQSLIYQIVHEEPASLLEANPDLPPDAECVIRRALAKNPDQRFSGCGVFARALDDAISASDQRTRLTARPKLFSKRRLLEVIAALSLAAASYFGWHSLNRHPVTGNGSGGAKKTEASPNPTEGLGTPKSVPSLTSAPNIETRKTPNPPSVPPAREASERSKRISNLHASISHAIESKRWTEAQLGIADLLRLAPGDKQGSLWKTEVASLRARDSRNESPALHSPPTPAQTARTAGGEVAPAATVQPALTPKGPGSETTTATITPPISPVAEPPSIAVQISGHINRAQAMQLSGNYAGAIDEFKAARAMDPNNRVATDGIAAATEARDSRALQQRPAQVPAQPAAAPAADLQRLRAEFAELATKAVDLNDRLDAADRSLKGAGGLPGGLKAARNGMNHELDVASAARQQNDPAGFAAAIGRAKEHMAAIEQDLVKH